MERVKCLLLLFEVGKAKKLLEKKIIMNNKFVELHNQMEIL